MGGRLIVYANVDRGFDGDSESSLARRGIAVDRASNRASPRHAE